MFKKNQDITQKHERDYTCDWCDFKFKQKVRKIISNADGFTKKTRGLSDQVQCPQCQNFIKTWQ